MCVGICVCVLAASMFVCVSACMCISVCDASGVPTCVCVLSVCE